MREYADKSKPINQMDVVQAILDKSRNPMAESLYPNAYGRALSDDTAQRVLGFGGATLDNVMDPAQLASLNAIKADIQRQSFADTAGRGVGSDTVQKLAYSGLSDAAGIPSFVRALAIGRAGGNLLGLSGSGNGLEDTAGECVRHGLRPIVRRTKPNALRRRRTNDLTAGPICQA